MKTKLNTTHTTASSKWPLRRDPEQHDGIHREGRVSRQALKCKFSSAGEREVGEKCRRRMGERENDCAAARTREAAPG